MDFPLGTVDQPKPFFTHHLKSTSEYYQRKMPMTGFDRIETYSICSHIRPVIRRIIDGHQMNFRFNYNRKLVVLRFKAHYGRLLSVETLPYIGHLFTAHLCYPCMCQETNIVFINNSHCSSLCWYW